MLSNSVLCLVALAAAASADYTANLFMDKVLAEMRGQVAQNGLDPLRVMPFQIKVKKNGLTNRDLKVNYTQGSMFGLASIFRQGDCSFGTVGAEMKIGCYLSLTPVSMMMNAEAKGDAISGNKHAISTKTTVAPNTFALVEIQGPRGGSPNLARLNANSITMTTSVVDGKLDLNSGRFKDFAAQTHYQLSGQLIATLTGTYSAAMRTVLIRNRMP